MKSLLVAMNAKYIHSNLGIYSIYAYALEHGVSAENIEYAEYTINQLRDEILADIYKRNPDWIGFSCYIWNIKEIKSIAGELHKLLPDTPIWFGGPEVSYNPQELIKECPYITGIMVGEGEETFLELYQYYQNSAKKLTEKKSISGGDISTIRGIVYRCNEGIVATPPRPRLSMDDLAFPYKYIDNLEHRIIYYETSRGCPFGCSYCLSSVERQVRLRSMELVERELQYFLDKKVPQVKFVDRTFNCVREHTFAIWKYIYEHDNGVTNFHFEMSAELLNDEEIEYVSRFRPGLVQFEIGVQTTNEQTMKAINRPCDLEVLKNKVDRIHESRNIHEHLDLIAGLPYEDYASFRNSYNDVHAMAPDQLQLGFLKLLKGSPMEAQQEKYGIVCQSEPPYEVLYTPWLPYSDVLRLKQVEDMTERYYNSLQFELSRRYMESLFETPFDFYQRLGEYYSERDAFGIKHSRIQAYEILLDFIDAEGIGDRHTLAELMTFDLYARENLKSRPAFMPDENVREWKEYKRLFYTDEENMRALLPRYSAYDSKQIMRMTHMEAFHYDISGLTNEKEISDDILNKYKLDGSKQVLLFDYERRNPLSNQCRVVEIKTQKIAILLAL